MFKLLFKSYSFLIDYLVREIENSGLNYKVIDNEFIQVEIENFKLIPEISKKFLQRSRNFNGLYLVDNITKEDKLNKNRSKAISNFINNLKKINSSIIYNNDKNQISLFENNIKLEEFSIKNMKFIGLDLIGFPPTKRDYLIRFDKSIEAQIPEDFPNIISYIFEREDISNGDVIFDPNAGYGRVLIEASLYNDKINLFQKKINETNFFKIFKVRNTISTNQKQNLKLIGFVEDSNSYSNFKENNNYFQRKIKLSKASLDWIDVKFKKKSFDYVITLFPLRIDLDLKEEYEKELFYQCEFIVRKKIIIISKYGLSKGIIKENGLKVEKILSTRINKADFKIYFISPINE